jgi:Xaa-Pro aminopeptidase
MRLLRPTSALLLGLAFPTACAPAAQPAAAPAPAPQVAAPRPTDWTPPTLPPPQPISRADYASRRAALAAELEDGVFVAFAAPTPQFDYLQFAQPANFRYLTGIMEPGAALVMVKRGAAVEELIFVRRRDPAREVWEGRMLGTEGAQALTGLRSLTADRLVPVLDSLVREHRSLAVLTQLPAAEAGALLTSEQQIIAGVLARNPGVQVRHVTDAVRRLRAAKSAVELDLIRRAVYISVLAHRAALQTLQPGMNEFEMQALVEYTFRRYGAERPAYASIVGSGPNSTTLHYNENDRFMNAGEVLLIDAGASYRGYAADITRTMPVTGRFTERQREIYEIVLAAQKAAEQLVRPGATMAQLDSAANNTIAEGLARLGLIDSATATYRCESPRWGEVCPQFRLYYMHRLGHSVGLDVHDQPDLYQYGQLGVGSAFTIEPGIYVRADAFDHLPDTPENRAMIQRLRPVAQRYVNIGVRIEDVYFVTATGAERVSAGVPREVAEVEALMAAAPVAAGARHPDLVEWYRFIEEGR